MTGASSGKFKVGDRVRPKGGAYSGYPKGSQYNIPRTAMTIIEGGSDKGYVVLDVGSGQASPPLSPFFLETATEGPIRTVTRREIVPGTYGGVTIGDVFSDSVEVDLTYVDGSPDTLREAARIFNEIADVLEENAG